MTIYDAPWNPTTAAAAANEGHDWPSSRPAFSSGVPDHVGDPAQVHLGGQAPMFIHADVADPGLVRLGGQSPMFPV